MNVSLSFIRVRTGTLTNVWWWASLGSTPGKRENAQFYAHNNLWPLAQVGAIQSTFARSDWHVRDLIDISALRSTFPHSDRWFVLRCALQRTAPSDNPTLQLFSKPSNQSVSTLHPIQRLRTSASIGASFRTLAPFLFLSVLYWFSIVLFFIPCFPFIVLCFLLLFSLVFFALAYINPCTLFQRKSDIIPHRFAPRSYSHVISFQPAHLGIPSQPSLITSFLLRSWLAPFAHPHTQTASAVVFLFCFGHSQRSVSASARALVH